jgi:hypothetical protein
MVITDNLSSHTRLSTRTWLAGHPRSQHAHPEGRLLAESAAGLVRLFRREAFAGQSFATPGEITLATRVATCQLNARARPWVWAAHHHPHATNDGSSCIAFEERSTRACLTAHVVGSGGWQLLNGEVPWSAATSSPTRPGPRSSRCCLRPAAPGAVGRPPPSGQRDLVETFHWGALAGPTRALRALADLL